MTDLILIRFCAIYIEGLLTMKLTIYSPFLAAIHKWPKNETVNQFLSTLAFQDTK